MEKIPSNLSSILKSESEPSISDENVNQDESVLVKDYFKRMENVLQTFGKFSKGFCHNSFVVI